MADRVAVLRRVLDGRRALCSDGVTHDELCALLPHYAAGLLDEDASCALRMHLADGCVACLDELFARPVGLPRALRQEAPSTALQEETPSPTVPRQERPFPAPLESPEPSQRALLVTTVGLTLALAAAVGWTIFDLRAGEIAARRKAARVGRRLAEAEVARARLTARVDALGREVAAARDDASRQAEAAREAIEGRTQLAEELAAARDQIATLGRALSRRDAELDRLRLGLDGRDALHDVIGTPDVDLLQLHPVVPFRDVRGRALWHPGGDTVVLYAFNLPTVASGQGYRVRLTLEDGRQLAGPSLTARRGDASTVIRLDPPTARLQAIEVTLDPSGTPILAWRGTGG